MKTEQILPPAPWQLQVDHLQKCPEIQTLHGYVYQVSFAGANFMFLGRFAKYQIISYCEEVTNTTTRINEVYVLHERMIGAMIGDFI